MSIIINTIIMMDIVCVLYRIYFKCAVTVDFSVDFGNFYPCD
jgi:hypothetical protein